MKPYEIEKLLKEKGKSINKVSDEIKIAQPTLAKLLKKDLRLTSLENALKIAEYLNCTIEELIYNKEPLNKSYIEISNKIKDRNNEEYKIINNFIDFIDSTKKDLLEKK